MDLANKIAASLAKKLGYSDEQRAVIAYGLGAALQMLELFGIALLFGLVFDCVYECMIIFIGVGLLRRTTGGTHCTTYMACILTSSLSICLLAFVCRYLIPAWLDKWFYILLGMLFCHLIQCSYLMYLDLFEQNFLYYCILNYH